MINIDNAAIPENIKTKINYKNCKHCPYFYVVNKNSPVCTHNFIDKSRCSIFIKLIE